MAKFAAKFFSSYSSHNTFKHVQKALDLKSPKTFGDLKYHNNLPEKMLKKIFLLLSFFPTTFSRKKIQTTHIFGNEIIMWSYVCLLFFILEM